MSCSAPMLKTSHKSSPILRNLAYRCLLKVSVHALAVPSWGVSALDHLVQDVSSFFFDISICFSTTCPNWSSALSPLSLPPISPSMTYLSHDSQLIDLFTLLRLPSYLSLMTSLLPSSTAHQSFSVFWTALRPLNW